MVEITASMASPAWQALQLMKARSAEAEPGEAKDRSILSSIYSSPPEGGVGTDILAAIQGLTGERISPAREALERVRSWIKSGLVDDAAQGRDSAWLEEMAREGALGSLPSLDGEGIKDITLEEYRVYTEARARQAYYNGQPKTLEEAKEKFVSMMLSSYPPSIDAQEQQIASGELSDELAAAVQASVDEMKMELEAARNGTIKIELADPKFEIQSSRIPYHRDANGVIAGVSGTGPKGPNWDELHKAYPDARRIYIPYSEYIGGYVITI